MESTWDREGRVLQGEGVTKNLGKTPSKQYCDRFVDPTWKEKVCMRMD